MSTPKTFKLENLNWKVRVRGGRELTYMKPINKPGIPYDVVDSAPDWPWYEHVEWEWLYFVYKGNVRKVLCALALEVKTVAFHVSTVEDMTELELAFLAGLLIGRFENADTKA